jgi:hypothetical protein
MHKGHLYQGSILLQKSIQYQCRVTECHRRHRHSKGAPALKLLAAGDPGFREAGDELRQ